MPLRPRPHVVKRVFHGGAQAVPCRHQLRGGEPRRKRRHHRQQRQHAHKKSQALQRSAQREPAPQLFDRHRQVQQLRHCGTFPLMPARLALRSFGSQHVPGAGFYVLQTRNVRVDVVFGGLRRDGGGPPSPTPPSPASAAAAAAAAAAAGGVTTASAAARVKEATAFGWCQLRCRGGRRC